MMKLFVSLLPVLACFIALASTVSAVQFTKWPSEVHTGEPATIKWLGDPNTPVTITLQQGPPENLKDVKVLTPDAQGGSFTWVPDDSLPESADYAFKISQGDQVNYSGQIKVLGGPADIPEVKQKVQVESSTSSDVSSSQNTATQTSSMATTSSMSTTTAATVPTATASDTQATRASNALVATTSAPVQSSSAGPASQTPFASTTSAGLGASNSAIASKTELSAASLYRSSLHWVMGALGLVVYAM